MNENLLKASFKDTSLYLKQHYTCRNVSGVMQLVLRNEFKISPNIIIKL